jgi:hypothetical protein
MCPFPAREGQYIEHKFEFGSSGLFGEETPGNWLSESQVINCYKHIFLYYKIFRLNGFIYDLPLGKKLLETLQVIEPWYDTHASL